MKKKNLIYSIALSVALAILPFKSQSEDTVIIQNGTGINGSDVGSSYVYEGHRPGCSEGLDSNDVLRSTSGSTKTNWFSIFTELGDKHYRKEFRPEESETLFTNYLAIVGNVTNSSNRLSFSASDLDNNRVYTVLVNHYKTNFNTTANIREVNESTGDIILPNITGTNNEVYARVIVSSRYLKQPEITGISASSNISLEASVQPGSLSGLEISSNANFTESRQTNFDFVISNTNNFNQDYTSKIFQVPKTNSCFIRVKSKTE